MDSGGETVKGSKWLSLAPSKHKENRSATQKHSPKSDFFWFQIPAFRLLHFTDGEPAEANAQQTSSPASTGVTFPEHPEEGTLSRR
jgi:hypothetical protein